MYRVEWHQAASDLLAELWMQADSMQRKAITSACHAIDKLLQSDPENEGESRPKNRRIQFYPPLAVTFEVDTDKRVVTVLHIRVFGKRKK